MHVLFAGNRFIILISSCIEGIHRFAAKSVDKNRWRLMKQEKRTGNLVDLLGNQMPRIPPLTKLYEQAPLLWPNHINFGKTRERENRRRNFEGILYFRSYFFFNGVYKGGMDVYKEGASDCAVFH